MIRKSILLITLSLCTWHLYAQNADSCGLDENPQLTSYEADFLNHYFAESREDFDFAGKLIFFLTGSSGSKPGNKREYFSHIRSWTEAGDDIASQLIILSDEEREKSHYDALVTYWVKVLTKKQRKKVLERAGNNSEDLK